MAERNVAGVIRAERHAEPGEVGAHRVDVGRLGVDRHDPGREGAGDPVLEPLHGLYGLIGRSVDGRPFGQGLAVAFGRSRRTRGVLLRRIELRRPVGTATPVPQPLEQAGEAVRFEKLGQRLVRGRFEREVFERDRKRAVFLELDQFAAEQRHLAPFDQTFAQLARLHRRRRIERALQRPVVLDQFARGLGADAEDARNVVDAIAHQREHVADQLGPHAELLDHLGDIDALVLHRVEHVDAAALDSAVRLRALPDELHQVLVARDDRHVPAAARRLDRVGGDQVVGFEIVFLDAGQAEGARGIPDQRELRDEVLGRRRPVGLVLIVERVAEAGRSLVQDHRQVGWAVRLVEVVGELPQHRRVTIDRAHRHAVRIGQRRQSVIGAEDVGRTVDQVEMLLVGHGRVLRSMRLAGNALATASRGGEACLATKLPLFVSAEIRFGGFRPAPVRERS